MRAKSIRLTGYLEYLLNRNLQLGYSIVTPSDPERRGAQLSIRVPGKTRHICEKLAAQGVLCDWREPDIMRVAPAPLYNSFVDVYRFVAAFNEVLGANHG